MPLTIPGPLRSRTALTLFAACAGFWLLTDLSQAQTAQQRRLVLDVELQRQGPVQSGADRGEQTLSQRWQFSALLQSDGVPIPYNPLDADDQRRQLQLAQRQAAAVPTAPPADMAALQARAQTVQARCGQDSACLMREASALSAAAMPGVNPGSQGRMQAQGHAAGFADGGPATPYLLFTGVVNCGLQTTVRLDDRVKGRFNDVQGVVNYIETAQGQETRRDDTPCPTLQAVLDTRNGRVWTALAMVPQEVQGVRTREETNRRGQRHEGRIGLQWREAQDWLQQRLIRLSAEGQDQARLPAGAGQAEIRMKWSFKSV